jgi:hypothetical protein
MVFARNAESLHRKKNMRVQIKKLDFFDILRLCLSSKCPVCGKGKLFSPLLQVQTVGEIFFPLRQCERCSFVYKREPGYYSGILMPTLSILASMTGIFFAAIDYFVFRPEEIIDVVIAAGFGVAFGMLFFIRTSIAIFMSFDHALCPPGNSK